jgi:hypothetical protein
VGLTSDQLALVRAEIGSAAPPSDADLDVIYARRGGLVGVVREVWNTRLTTLLAQPASFSIPGDYSQSTGENIRAITAKLEQWMNLPDTSDAIGAGGVGVGIGQLVRDTADPAR